MHVHVNERAIVGPLATCGIKLCGACIYISIAFNLLLHGC